MSWNFGVDGKYLDRRGCGDEFYMDSRLKWACMFAELEGRVISAPLDELEDEDFDETANH